MALIFLCTSFYLGCVLHCCLHIQRCSVYYFNLYLLIQRYSSMTCLHIQRCSAYDYLECVSTTASTYQRYSLLLCLFMPTYTKVFNILFQPMSTYTKMFFTAMSIYSKVFRMLLKVSSVCYLKYLHLFTSAYVCLYNDVEQSSRIHKILIFFSKRKKVFPPNLQCFS